MLSNIWKTVYKHFFQRTENLTYFISLSENLTYFKTEENFYVFNCLTHQRKQVAGKAQLETFCMFSPL